MKAMILCAGLGTRFRPHTQKLAKPALPFMGVSLAGYGLYYLEQAGLTDLIINTHHLPKTVEGAISCLTNEKDYTVTFLNEEKILGSGGGIGNAKEHLQHEDHFVVINGDEVIFHANPKFINDMIEQHKKSGAIMTMLTIPHPEAGKQFAAVEINEQNEITKIGVKGDSPNYVHNCGIYVYSKKLFDYMPTDKPYFSIFQDCVNKALENGEKAMAYVGPKDLLWLDTSGEKEYLESTKMAVELLQGQDPTSETLKSILTRFHQNIKIKNTDKATIILAKDAQLKDTANVTGFAVLGAGSIFDQGTIHNAVIGPNVHVHEMVSLKNQLLI